MSGRADRPSRPKTTAGRNAMPVAPTYPGVYIEELPSPIRTIIGVDTGMGAFVGPAPRGPAEATLVTSAEEYASKFGGLSKDSLMSYAVAAFFLNGGQRAQIVRVSGSEATKATL